jgi:hypothetical protein
LSNVELQDFRGQILRVSKVHDLYTAPSGSIRTQIFPADGTLNSKRVLFWTLKSFQVSAYPILIKTDANSRQFSSRSASAYRKRP